MGLSTLRTGVIDYITHEVVTHILPHTDGL